MGMRTEETEAVEGWEPVPPGHPGRAAFEERMRALGVRPATRWEPRLDRRVFKKPGWRELLVDGARRVWYGPVPEPLSDEELETVMRPREDDEDVPELVPPDDPDRLAWEAELRSRGIRPAEKWNFPLRAPVRKRSVWERIRHRVSLGW